MELLDFVRVVFVLIVLHIDINHGQRVTTDAKNGEMCQRLAKEPYFDSDVVVGKPWRVYYTWNMNADSRCMDLVFKNSSAVIANRFWNDMTEYLEQQPYWDAAALLWTMGEARREILLFSNQGVAGSFDGVPNVIRDGTMSPRRGTVPLLKFQMKLINDNKYLLITDCHFGFISLSARVGRIINKAKASAVAKSLNFGEGFPACTNNKKNYDYY